MAFNNGLIIQFLHDSTQSTLGAYQAAAINWTYPISVQRVVTIAGSCYGENNAVVLAYNNCTTTSCNIFRCNYVNASRKVYSTRVCLIAY